MTFRRPLDSNERLLYICDKISAFNMVFILGVRGSFSLDALRRAINGVQKLHPILQTKIACSSQGRIEFVTDESLEIPLARFEDDISKIGGYVEAELNTRFNTQTGPLSRFTLIEHAENFSTLLFVAHHAIGDGVSCCILTEDFLSLLAGFELDFKLRELPTPIGMCMPKHLSGAGAFYSHAREVIRSLLLPLKTGFPAPHALINADLSKRTSMVALETVDSIRTKRILDGCKSHGCSMHGALGAASLLAIKAHLLSHNVNSIGENRDGSGRNERPTTLQLISPVSIRNKLIPAIERELGLYVTTQATNHQLTSATDFWSLARDISSDLRKNINRESHLAFMPLASKYLVKLMSAGDKLLGENKFSQWLCTTFPPCVALSNLGAADLRSEYGDIYLDSVSFLGSLSAFGAISSFVWTFNGKLFWSFVAMFPSLDRRHLDLIAKSSVNYLLQHTQFDATL